MSDSSESCQNSPSSAKIDYNQTSNSMGPAGLSTIPTRGNLRSRTELHGIYPELLRTFMGPASLECYSTSQRCCMFPTHLPWLKPHKMLWEMHLKNLFFGGLLEEMGGLGPSGWEEAPSQRYASMPLRQTPRRKNSAGNNRRDHIDPSKWIIG